MAQIVTFSSTQSCRILLQAEVVMDESFCLLWPRNDRLFLHDIRENDPGPAFARPHLLAQRNTVCCLRPSLGVASSDPIKSASLAPYLMCTGDFEIKEVIHHLLHVMLIINKEEEKIEGEMENKRRKSGLQLYAFICQLYISSCKLVLSVLYCSLLQSHSFMINYQPGYIDMQAMNP